MAPIIKLIFMTFLLHLGCAQYFKESVGPLAESPPLDGERNRSKLEEEYRHKKCSLCNRHLVLSGEQWKPFMDFDENSVLLKGSIMRHVIEYLQKSLNFTWELRRPPDAGWGHDYGNGTWSGMIGMLMANEIDIAVGEFIVLNFQYATLYYHSYY